MPVLYASEIPEDISLVSDAVSQLVYQKIGVYVELIPVVYSTAAFRQRSAASV